MWLGADRDCRAAAGRATPSPGVPSPTWFTARKCSRPLASVGPTLQEILREHRLAYLYGCVAADIVQAKNYTRSLYTHCHCWPVGWQIVEAATQRARARVRLRLPVAPRGRRLLAQPLRAGAADRQLRGARARATSTGRPASTPRSARDRRRLIREVFEHRYPDCDRLVERVVERTLFSFRTNKRIFDSVMAVQRLGAVAGAGARPRFALALPAARSPRSSASTACASPPSTTCWRAASGAHASAPTRRAATRSSAPTRSARKLRALRRRGQLTDAIVAELRGLSPAA